MYCVNYVSYTNKPSSFLDIANLLAQYKTGLLGRSSLLRRIPPFTIEITPYRSVAVIIYTTFD